MAGKVHILCCGLAVAGALTVSSCKREERSFHEPASDAELPEDVGYQNPVRAGAAAPAIASSTQPVSVGRLSHEPYGKTFMNNAQAQSDGQRLYEAMNCSGCHAHGGGGMGPPLLDPKWFYGGDPEDVYLSILQGRPNGMPSFRGRIADYQMWELVAYVRSLSGQANSNAATGREDHLHAQPPPNSMEKETPKKVPEPTTGPATRTVG